MEKYRIRRSPLGGWGVWHTSLPVIGFRVFGTFEEAIAFVDERAHVTEPTA